ncbi:MAG: hypothetical protein AABX89_02615 [Candidatus Thermoplasmatota archaeon]
MADVRLAQPAAGASWGAVLERMRENLELEDLEVGEVLETSDGATGRILEAAANLLRFTWQEPSWPAPSTVALRLDGGALRVEHTTIPDAATAWYLSFWQDELAFLA